MGLFAFRSRFPEALRGKAAVKRYWEIIADNLKKAGLSYGCVSAIDSEGRTIWIVDAHRGDGKRFIVRADEKLTTFLELERVTRNDSNRSKTPSLGPESFRGAGRRACVPAEGSRNRLRSDSSAALT